MVKITVNLSGEAKQRLEWFDYYQSHGHNAKLTCRHFGISPQTFYRWKPRYDPHNLEKLESGSCRPKHLRQPTASRELVEAILRLRETYPQFGKDKLVVMLRQEGFSCSASMVGRTLKRLKDKGVLIEEQLRPLVSEAL